MPALLHLARQRAGLLSAAAVASMVAAFLGLAPLLAIYAVAIEIAADVPDDAVIRQVVVWTAAAIALRWLLLFSGNALSHLAAYNLLYDLRIAIADRLTRLPLGFVIHQNSGDLKRVLQEDVERLEMVLGHTLPDVSAAAAMMLGGALILFTIDPVMALAAFAPLPLAIALQAMLWRRAEGKVAAYFDAAARMNSALVEFIRAVPVIKIFGRSDASMGHLRRTIGDYHKVVADFSTASIPAWVGYMAVLGSGLLFILPVGGWRIVTGSVDLPTFVLFMLIGVGLMQTLVQIMNFTNQIRVTLTGLSRIEAVLTEPTLPEAAVTREPASHDVVFDRVGFAYGDEAVLHDISFTCPAGSRTAIVGPSGAGKTTLAQLAVRFWDPQEGEIRIGGVPLPDLAAPTLNGLTASVFQDIFLFHDTVMDNIRVGKPDAGRDEVIAAAKAAQIHDFILSLADGYDCLLGERGARLSGGQRQRLSIARAILKDAPIILLDEATAFADPLNERRIQDALDRLRSDKTVIMIAHRLDSIRDADQIVVLDEGRLVDLGPHDLLIARCPVYQRLWAAYERIADAGSPLPSPHATSFKAQALKGTAP